MTTWRFCDICGAWLDGSVPKGVDVKVRDRDVHVIFSLHLVGSGALNPDICRTCREAALVALGVSA